MKRAFSEFGIEVLRNVSKCLTEFVCVDVHVTLSPVLCIHFPLQVRELKLLVDDRSNLVTKLSELTEGKRGEKGDVGPKGPPGADVS